MSEHTTDAMLGRLTSALYLKEHQGDLVGEDGEPAYRLYTTIPGGQPMIHNLATGKTWTCAWDELLEMAKAAGIDEPGDPGVLPGDTA